jgi:AcrR family transcriptional regulator
MVERILAAGRSVLIEHGYERASTSRIAAAAGISPGSLYQYFADKDAILGQVLDRYTDQLQARITDAFMTNLGAASQRGERAAVRGVFEVMLGVLEADAPMLRVLVEQPPLGASRQRLAEFPKQVDQLVTTALLFQLGPRGRPVDAAAWILVRSIRGVTVNYALDPPPIGRDVILDELTDLVMSYLGPIEPSRPALCQPS